MNLAIIKIAGLSQFASRVMTATQQQIHLNISIHRWRWWDLAINWWNGTDQHIRLEHTFWNIFSCFFFYLATKLSISYWNESLALRDVCCLNFNLRFIHWWIIAVNSMGRDSSPFTNFRWLWIDGVYFKCVIQRTHLTETQQVDSLVCAHLIQKNSFTDESQTTPLD